MAHPDGPAAGVRAMREAWEAAVAGVPLDEHAREPSRWRRALAIARMSRARALPDGPLVAFYGDDFTGSSAAMEARPSPACDGAVPRRRRRRSGSPHFAGYRVIGIAGVAAREPRMDGPALPPVFRVCGRSARRSCITRSARPSTPPRMSARSDAPSTSRREPFGLGSAGGGDPAWAAPGFGDLFASVDGMGYRLDRHPTMRGIRSRRWTRLTSAAPGGQTAKPIGLIDFVAMKRGEARRGLAGARGGSRDRSLDVLDEETLAEAGRLVWENRGERFAVGSQGPEAALVAYSRSAGLLREPDGRASRAVSTIACVSGSVSPITAAQIATRSGTVSPIRSTRRRPWTCPWEARSGARSRALLPCPGPRPARLFRRRPRRSGGRGAAQAVASSGAAAERSTTGSARARRRPRRGVRGPG